MLVQFSLIDPVLTLLFCFLLTHTCFILIQGTYQSPARPTYNTYNQVCLCFVSLTFTWNLNCKKL